MEMTEKKVQKYTTSYMSIGICFGISLGLIDGLIFFPENIALGVCLGMPIGNLLGTIIGAEKDMKLSKKMMRVSRIEDVEDSLDRIIYVLDKDGVEKEYRITKEIWQKEKFFDGARVAEESTGCLISLEK